MSRSDKAAEQPRKQSSQKNGQAADATGHAPRATAEPGFSPGGIERCSPSPRCPCASWNGPALEIPDGIRPASGFARGAARNSPGTREAPPAHPELPALRRVEPPDLTRPTRFAGEIRLEAVLPDGIRTRLDGSRTVALPLSYWHIATGPSRSRSRNARAPIRGEGAAPLAGVRRLSYSMPGTRPASARGIDRRSRASRGARSSGEGICPWLSSLWVRTGNVTRSGIDAGGWRSVS